MHGSPARRSLCEDGEHTYQQKQTSGGGRSRQPVAAAQAPERWQAIEPTGQLEARQWSQPETP